MKIRNNFGESLEFLDEKYVESRHTRKDPPNIFRINQISVILCQLHKIVHGIKSLATLSLRQCITQKKRTINKSPNNNSGLPSCRICLIRIKIRRQNTLSHCPEEPLFSVKLGISTFCNGKNDNFDNMLFYFAYYWRTCQNHY